MSDLVGKKLKDFYVLRRLGRGAMAEVYLAQQLSLGRQVALKVLNAELARDPSYVRRFHHEARAAAALVHGGIVQIYEVGQDDDVHFIAQEYVAGRNLGEVIRSHGSLAPPLVLDILRQVAAALSKAASQNVVHRDIKPENIMLAATGEVKVADFGLARVAGDANLTQVGITMGTPLYMSPEQIEGREIDSRSDIYSLGITAYHMLTGEPPFTGDSPLAVAVQHLNQTPKPISDAGRSSVADLSEAGRSKTSVSDSTATLARVIERMIAKKPADRFRDPAALLEELNALLKQGIDSGWAARSDQGSLIEILCSADQRSVATWRLDELMRTTAMTRPKRVRRAWIAATLIASIILGAGAAAVIRPRSLLADAESGPKRSSDVWGQLYQAKLIDTEGAWLAVANNFPEADAYYHNLARQGLVYHYLSRTQDYEKVITPSEELASAAEPAFQAFGLAGLVIAYTNLGDDEQAYYANQQLTAEMRDLLNEHSPRMWQLFSQALDDLAERAL